MVNEAKFAVNEINEIRNQKVHMNEFKKFQRQVKNISDMDADMETLKNGIENLVEDMNLIR